MTRTKSLPNNSLQLTGPAAEKRLIRKRIRLAGQLSSRPFGGVDLGTRDDSANCEFGALDPSTSTTPRRRQPLPGSCALSGGTPCLMDVLRD